MQLTRKGRDSDHCHNGGYAARAVRPLEVVRPWHLDSGHFPVQKQQRAKRLVVRGHRYPTFGCQHGQERFDLALPHDAPVVDLVKTDERFDPMNVSFVGAKAIVQLTDLLTQPVQQPG